MEQKLERAPPPAMANGNQKNKTGEKAPTQTLRRTAGISIFLIEIHHHFVNEA